MATTQLKTSFVVEDKYKAFYTGGVVQTSLNGDHLFCQCGNTVQCLDVNSGKVAFAIGSEEDDEVTSFVLSPDDDILVVASRNLLLKQWNWKERTLTRTWKATHSGPISCMAFDSTSTLLAAGGSDASIKVYDVIKQYCTHNLLGHAGVISVAAFHPDAERLQLVSAGDDYNVRVWNLQTSMCLAILEGHYSAVQGIQFSPTGDQIYTGGRDNVVIVWDANKLEKLRTIPVYESIESLVLLPQGKPTPAGKKMSSDQLFVTGGSKGVLKIWNARTSQCIYPKGTEGEQSIEDATSEGSLSPITQVEFNAKSSTLTMVTHDHNICLTNVEDFTPKKYFVGYNDDVLDMKLIGENESHLVVATNSQLVKVFDITTWSCQVLHGHTDIVLCVSVKRGGMVFGTGSKDNTIRIWHMNKGTKLVQCVAVGSGHTHAVNSVSMSRLHNSHFIVSGSQDCTLKFWELPKKFKSGEITRLTCTLTEHAHEKEINSVVVTPNDKMIASGSQDKTAKLWTADTLTLVGVFRGHKRSIWCVQFSPIDQALATASADGTIKIWSLGNFSCVKTFEGHQSSVLRVHFLTRGMQLLSTGSDGLVKLWGIKSNECIATWDEHDEKVWALAITKDETKVMTGAGDSTICVWKDVTEEEQKESIRKQEEFILQEQQLANLLQDKKYVKAIGLAINLNQPFKVLNIFKEMLDEAQGREDATRTLNKLRDDQIDSIMGYCTKWNGNSKHCHVAQFILNVTLARYSPDELLKLSNIKTSVESLLPYTERHFQRMNRLQQQATFVEYTWQTMKFSADLALGEQVTLDDDEAAQLEQWQAMQAAQSAASEVRAEPSADALDEGDGYIIDEVVASSDDEPETRGNFTIFKPKSTGDDSDSSNSSSEDDSETKGKASKISKPKAKLKSTTDDSGSSGDFNVFKPKYTGDDSDSTDSSSLEEDDDSQNKVGKSQKSKSKPKTKLKSMEEKLDSSDENDDSDKEVQKPVTKPKKLKNTRAKSNLTIKPLLEPKLDDDSSENDSEESSDDYDTSSPEEALKSKKIKNTPAKSKLSIKPLLKPKLDDGSSENDSEENDDEDDISSAEEALDAFKHELKTPKRGSKTERLSVDPMENEESEDEEPTAKSSKKQQKTPKKVTSSAEGKETPKLGFSALKNASKKNTPKKLLSSDKENVVNGTATPGTSVSQKAKKQRQKDNQAEKISKQKTGKEAWTPKSQANKTPKSEKVKKTPKTHTEELSPSSHMKMTPNSSQSKKTPKSQKRKSVGAATPPVKKQSFLEAKLTPSSAKRRKMQTR